MTFGHIDATSALLVIMLLKLINKSLIEFQLKYRSGTVFEKKIYHQSSNFSYNFSALAFSARYLKLNLN